MNFDELAKKPGAKVIEAEPAQALSFDELAKHPRAKVVSDEPVGKPHPSFVESLAAGGGQAALGLGDEIGAGLQAVGAALTPGMSARETYREARRENRQIDEAAQEEHPGAYYGGLVAGAVGTAPLLPSFSAGKGAGLAAKIAAGAKTGLVQGAAFGLGSSDADLTEGDVIGAAKDVAKGSVLGGTFGAGGAAAGHVLGRASNFFGGKVTDASDSALKMARENVGATGRTANAEARAAIQKGSRYEEQFMRYLEDPNISPELRQLLETWKASPESRELIESVLRNQLEDAPNVVGEIAAKKAAAKAIQDDTEALIAKEAARIASPAEAVRQVGARVARYGLPAAGLAAGNLVGGPVAGAAGYIAGGGARPAQHAIKRMLLHPAVAGTAARAAEGLTGAAGELLEGATGTTGAALEKDVANSVSNLVRQHPEALGAWANYFQPDAPDEDHELTAYVLSRTQPEFAAHMRELHGVPPGE